MHHLLAWYVLIPLALLAGPFASFTGLDSFVHRKVLSWGGGYGRRSINRLSEVLTLMTDGVPYWLAVSACFQPIHGGWKLLALLVIVGAFKLVAGRPYIDESRIDESSKMWFPVWSRRVTDWEAEPERILGNYAYPSGHTSALLGALLFGVMHPGGWVLFGILVPWFVWTSRHWASDILGGILLTAGVANLLGF